MGKIKAAPLSEVPATGKQPIQYMVNAEGQRTGVVVPIETWRKIRRKLKPKRSKAALVEDIRQALIEVKLVQDGKLPPGPTWEEFMEELRQDVQDQPA